MIIENSDINKYNTQQINKYEFEFTLSKVQLGKAKYEDVLTKLQRFRVVIPLWSVIEGTTSTEKCSGSGEPRTLEEQLEDVGLIHALNRCSSSVSLDIPRGNSRNYSNVKSLATELGLTFDMVHYKFVVDRRDPQLSNKIGLLNGENCVGRKQEIQYIIDVINRGIELGSRALMIWLTNESYFLNQKSFHNTLDNLREIYSVLPDDWKIFLGYNASQSKHCSMPDGDGGQRLLYSTKLGNKAFTMLNIEKHLFDVSVEQLTSLSLVEKLAGIYFNSSKKCDDSLTAGGVYPYRLFLIFNELMGDEERSLDYLADLSWLISTECKMKDPIENVLQSMEAIIAAYARALFVDRNELRKAKEANDIVMVQEILEAAFLTDVRPVVAESRLMKGGALSPIECFRVSKVRDKLIRKRSGNTTVL